MENAHDGSIERKAVQQVETVNTGAAVDGDGESLVQATAVLVHKANSVDADPAIEKIDRDRMLWESENISRPDLFVKKNSSAQRPIEANRDRLMEELAKLDDELRNKRDELWDLCIDNEIDQQTYDNKVEELEREIHQKKAAKEAELAALPRE